MRSTTLVLLFLIIGALLASVSTLLHPRFLNLSASVDSQRAIYQRTVGEFGGVSDLMPNWRNRVLLPYVIEWASHLPGFTYGRAYILARWATASLALAAFFYLARQTVHPDGRIAFALTLFFALSLIPTFLHIYEIPSDFLDAAFFAWLTKLTIGHRRIGFALLLPLALINRESAIFSVVVWWFLHGIGREAKAWRRELTWCVVLGAAGTAWVTILRVANAAAPGAAGWQTFEPADFWATNWRILEAWLAKPSFSHPYFFLAAYAAVLAVTIPPAWSRLSDPIRRLLLAGLAIFAISIVSNNLNELRIFIPTLVLTTLTLGSCFVVEPAPPPSCPR